MIKYLFLVIILTVSFFFFSFKNTEVPPAINGDEVLVGVNAILISKTLHDENGRFLPVFFSSQNLTDFKQPVTIYTTALLFKFFGPSFELMRQVSILFVLISAFLLFYLLKEIFNFSWALAGVLIFLTVPIIMIQSHLALENIAPLPFTIFWLLMLFNFKKSGKVLPLFFAGLTVGLSFYSYLGMRLIVPVLCVLTVIYIFYLKKKLFLSYSLFFILGVLPFLLTLPFIHKQYPGAILAYNRPVAPDSYQELILSYISSFDLSFLFIKGDSTPYHSTGKQGMFLLATLPIFLVGCYQAIRKKGFLLFVLMVFFAIPLPYGLVPSIHRASRLLILIPLFVILTTLGFITISKIRFGGLKVIFIFTLTGLIILNYFDFVRDYWYSYSGRVRPNFQGAAHIAFKDLYQKSKELSLTPVIQRSVYSNEKPGAKFFEQVYFPDSLKTWDLGEEVPQGVVLLHHQSDIPYLSDRELKNLNVEMPYYSLSVNY